MNNDICPFCGSTSCYDSSNSTTGLIVYNCSYFGFSAKLDSDIVNCVDREKKYKLYALVLEHALFHSHKNGISVRYILEKNNIDSDEQGNKLAHISDKDFPELLSERIDRTLINLCRKFPSLNNHIYYNNCLDRLIFSLSDDPSANRELFVLMYEYGYLKKSGASSSYQISIDGWKRFEQLTKNEFDLTQAFLAIDFSDNTLKIVDAIKEVLKDTPYKLCKIDEKEHNNQIVPEIFYEIDRSKFLIMDVTYPNLGAYYEAGYALGKGKQVIISCRKQEFNSTDKHVRPHFDIQQKSTVVWEDEKDLINRLKRRIEATIL